MTESKIQKACRLARERVSKMTPKQRVKLYVKGLSIIYKDEGPLVFKVVREYIYPSGPKGLVSSNVWLPDKHILSYKRGRWTRPLVGKVFVFTNFRAAATFASKGSAVKQVWLAKAEGLEKKNKRMLGYQDLAVDGIERFWAAQSGFFVDPPAGTAFCKAVKLLHRINL